MTYYVFVFRIRIVDSTVLIIPLATEQFLESFFAWPLLTHQSSPLISVYIDVMARERLSTLVSLPGNGT